MANQVQNPPSAAYWLSMIGSIIGILVSIGLFALGALAMVAVNSYGDLGNYYGDYSSYYDSSISAFNGVMVLYFALAVWCIITSIIVMVFARKLKANPMQHGKYGAIILIFSIIGVGTILGFIGGILAITYKPIPAGAAQPQYVQQPYYGAPPQQAYQPPPQAHACPQCGTMVQPGVKFCPNCGRQQY